MGTADPYWDHLLGFRPMIRAVCDRAAGSIEGIDPGDVEQETLLELFTSKPRHIHPAVVARIAQRHTLRMAGQK